MHEFYYFSDKYQQIERIGKYERSPGENDEEGEEGSYFPLLEDIKECRENVESWIFVMSNFLPVLVPGCKKKKGYNTNFGDVCEKATEALLFLFLENSYNKWVAKAKGEAGGTPLYSGKGKEEGRSGVRFGGYSQAGIDRYNELYDEIQDARATTEGKKMENNLMNEFKKLSGRTNNGMMNYDLEENKKPRFDDSFLTN